MKDLFGDEVVLIAKPGPWRRVTGYAAPPGTGPAGETCKTCRYKRTLSNGGKKSWIKCYHREAYRSCCDATDIKASAPACRHWEAING